MGTFDAEIVISPRCGIKKVITTTIQVIAPKLVFSKEEIDMGVLVVQGIAGQSQFTLTNDTDIEMPLIIDLRPVNIQPDNHKNIDCLTIKLLNEDEKLDVVAPTVKSEADNQMVFQEGQNLVDMEFDEDDLENSEDDEEELV